MADFMKKVTKLALKSAAVCAGVAASAALLHKYVKIQSNCSECGPSEDHFKHMNADSDIADLDIEDLSVDIDEDLSEGVSDLYAMDGVSEEDTAVDTKPLHEDDVNPEKTKEEDSVNSSIHL